MNGANEQKIIPTIDFEYDEAWTGGESDEEEGNYIDKQGAITQVPLSLIDETDEKTAFEKFTGLHRSHIIHWECEESEVYGHPRTQQQIDQIKQKFTVFVKNHRKTCLACSEWAEEERP